MRRTLSFLLFASAIFFPAFAYAGNFVYPFEKIAAPSCKWNAWSTLSDDCKIELPKITGADYAKYEKNQTYRRIYSVLWGTTYDYGWDLGLGSHLGVDIATSAGTPVRSIGDGEIITAGWSNGWGNVVTVKHFLADKTVIYSNYAHLSKILVTKGDSVSAGKTVGEVGNTGNSYGNHLHFQIDTTSQAHPYYYVSCGKGLDPLSVVNKGLCRDFLTANTIDPIAFLESGKVSVPGGPTKEALDAIRSRPQEKADRTHMKTRAEIQQEEIEEFLKKNSITIGLDTVTNVLVGGTITTFVQAGDNRWNAVRGNLPELGLDLVFDTKGLAVFPQKIVALDGGKRNFTIRGLKPGAYEIVFKMGKAVIARRTVAVLSTAETKTVGTAEIRSPKEILLGEDKTLLVVMKTKYGTPQLDLPYDGKFKLSILNGKAKFCNASRPSATACRNENLSEELVFSYGDTYRGALSAKMRTYSFAPIALAVSRIDTKKPISMARSKKDVSVANPRGLENTYAYYYEAVAALWKGWFPLKDGYLLQDREMVGSQAEELLRRYLGYRWLKAGDDFTKKKAAADRIAAFEKEFKTFDDYARISRGQLSEMLLRAKGDTLIVNAEKGFTDEAGTWKNAVTTLRLRYAFKWKDSFGERYFQPDKTITVGEALYLAEKIGF